MKNARADYLIVGNGTAAVAAIEAIRARDLGGTITLLSKEPYPAYSRPLISYFLAGYIGEDRMWMRPLDYYGSMGVDARLGTEATGVDTSRKAVLTAEDGGIEYGSLLVATGGSPFIPKIEGIAPLTPGPKRAGPEAGRPSPPRSRRGGEGDAVGRAGVAGLSSPGLAEGVFTFTTLDDAKAIGEYLSLRGPERALVIGAGLIGVKAAEALRARGVQVTMVELADRVLPLALDTTGSRLAAAAMKAMGVEPVCGTAVRRVKRKAGRVVSASTADGREIPCGMVVVAAGVTPEVGLLKDGSVPSDRKGIPVNLRCETAVSGIFAAGDAARGDDCVAGGSRAIPIFPNAWRQGAVAGTNMAGGDVKADRLHAMNSVVVFGLPTISIGQATATGPGYRELARLDQKAGTYRRIVLKEGRVVGALFTGDIRRAGILTGLIREQVEVDGLEDLLLNGDLGLLSLPSDYRKHVVAGEGIEV